MTDRRTTEGVRNNPSDTNPGRGVCYLTVLTYLSTSGHVSRLVSDQVAVFLVWYLTLPPSWLPTSMSVPAKSQGEVESREKSQVVPDPLVTWSDTGQKPTRKSPLTGSDTSEQSEPRVTPRARTRARPAATKRNSNKLRHPAEQKGTYR